MPYFATAQEWLSQSTLLLQARPTSTRITSKYTIPNPSKIRSNPNKVSTKTHPGQRIDNAKANEIVPLAQDKETPTTTLVTPAAATLTLKTYDPVSGVALKYKTNKAAEVGRLVQIMGRLSRGMAGLEMKEEAVTTETLEKNVPQVNTSEGKKHRKKGKR